MVVAVKITGSNENGGQIELTRFYRTLQIWGNPSDMRKNAILYEIVDGSFENAKNRYGLKKNVAATSGIHFVALCLSILFLSKPTISMTILMFFSLGLSCSYLYAIYGMLKEDEINRTCMGFRYSIFSSFYWVLLYSVLHFIMINIAVYLTTPLMSSMVLFVISFLLPTYYVYLVYRMVNDVNGHKL